MQRYVIGFCFTKDLEDVVLIRKNRPKWQAGKFNGVGGHVENGEFAVRAMTREFAEETGVVTTEYDWRLIATQGDHLNYELFIYASQGDHALEATTLTDENVVRYKVTEVVNSPFTPDPDAIYNVPWLILMSLQILKGRDHVTSHYLISH